MIIVNVQEVMETLKDSCLRDYRLKQCCSQKYLEASKEGSRLSGKTIYANYVVVPLFTEDVIALDTTITRSENKQLPKSKLAIFSIQIDDNHLMFTVFDICSNRVTCYDTDDYLNNHKESLSNSAKISMMEKKLWTNH